MGNVRKVEKLLGIPAICPRWIEYSGHSEFDVNQWRSIYKKRFRLRIDRSISSKTYFWRVNEGKDKLETGTVSSLEAAKLAINECIRRHL